MKYDVMFRAGGGGEPVGPDGVLAAPVRESLPRHAGLHEETAGQPAHLQHGRWEGAKVDYNCNVIYIDPVCFWLWMAGHASILRGKVRCDE